MLYTYQAANDALLESYIELSKQYDTLKNEKNSLNEEYKAYQEQCSILSEIPKYNQKKENTIGEI
jgi:hypothetical protein